MAYKVQVTILLLTYITMVLCEPPAPPSGNYLPPNDYSTISEDSFSAPPSNAYGPPRNNGYPKRPAITAAIVRPRPIYGAPKTEEPSAPANYQFEYKVQDQESANDFGHMEQRQGDQTQGRYFVLLPDGRKQIVNYEADTNGYRPTITYEEPSRGGHGGGGYRY